MDEVDRWIFWAFLRIGLMVLGAFIVIALNPAWYWKVFWAVVLANVGYVKSMYAD